MIEPGDFMYLGACSPCGSFWFSVAYEPYAVFHYLVRWDWPPSEWRRLYQGDRGVTLARWQVARIRALYPLLGEEDQRDIACHQRRSYGRSPLDVAAFPEEGEPDLGALLSDRKPLD